MNIDVEDLRSTVVPRSDQLNADDVVTGPVTVTITGIEGGNKEQPVILHIDGGYQPYKPGKGMRRVLIAAWGKNGHAWVGRSMTLYCDPEVMFGGVKVGGIRISHLSHLTEAMTILLTVTRGKRKPFTVQPLPAQASPPKQAADPRVETLMADDLRGELKKALAVNAPAFKPKNKGEVRAFLAGLEPDAFTVIYETVFPEREPGDEGEDF